MKTKHCEFFNEPCHTNKCPAYLEKRLMTHYEKTVFFLENNHQIEDPSVHSWCTRYEIRVEES